MYAPQKGPSIIPIGPIKNPIIKPIVEPQVPSLLPPDCLVNTTGKILSTIETTTAITPVITKATTEIFVYSEKNATKSPIQDKGAPGNTGTIVPAKPTIIKTAPATARKISKAIGTFYNKNIQLSIKSYL